MNPFESGAVIDMNMGHNSAAPAPIGADALRVAAQAALTALENLHEIDTETECITIDVRDEIDALRAALASTAHAAAPKAAQGGVGGRLHQIAEPAGDELPESVIDAVAEALGDAYDCGRVWNAWGYGAMGPDDFSVVAEDAERVAEIARAAINADRAMRAQAAPAAVASPLTKLQRKAIAVCFTSDKVSVSEVQRKLSISYADAQTLCQSIVDLGLTDELELAPSLS